MVWIEWFFQFLVSLIIFRIVFYIPGKLVREKWFGEMPDIVCWILGIAMWGWQAYVLGWLGLRWLVYGYVLGAIFWGRKWLFPKKTVISWRLIILFAVGAVVMLPGVFTSALPNNQGIKILGINTIDGSYHLALIESLKKSVPPREPGMVTEMVKNYHYWSDLILADVLRVFPINNFWMFYHYFPVLVLGLLIGTTFELGRVISGSKKTGYTFSLLFILAGNFDWLFWLVMKKELSFEMASLDNSAILFTNPPRVLAELVWMGGMVVMWHWLRAKQEKWGWLMIVILTITVGLKVYVGVAMVIQLLMMGGWWVYKKEYRNMRPLLMAAILTMFIYLPGNYGAGGFKWQPFAWPRQYFAEGKAGTLMWQNQEDEFRVHDNQLRIELLHWQMLVGFVVILSGTRLLGIFGASKMIKQNKPMASGLIMVGLIFGFIGLFWVQQSGAFELFNFLAVAEVILTLFLAIWLGNKNRWVVWLIILLTLPRSVFQAWDYYQKWINDNSEKVLTFDKEDVAFFNKAKLMVGENLVLTDISDDLGRYSPYTVQMTGWNLYFDGEGVLRAHGLDTVGQKNIVDEWLTTIDEIETKRILNSKKIRFIYLNKDSKITTEKKPILEDANNRLFEI